MEAPTSQRTLSVRNQLIGVFIHLSMVGTLNDTSVPGPTSLPLVVSWQTAPPLYLLPPPEGAPSVLIDLSLGDPTSPPHLHSYSTSNKVRLCYCRGFGTLPPTPGILLTSVGPPTTLSLGLSLRCRSVCPGLFDAAPGPHVGSSKAVCPLDWYRV